MKPIGTLTLFDNELCPPFESPNQSSVFSVLLLPFFLQAEFSRQSGENFLKANKAYLEQKQKTVVGNFDPLAAPEGGLEVPDFDADQPKLTMEEFMAQAAANRAEAKAAYEFQKGKVRQSSM
jgi:hypothetical protein